MHSASECDKSSHGMHAHDRIMSCPASRPGDAGRAARRRRRARRRAPRQADIQRKRGRQQRQVHAQRGVPPAPALPAAPGRSLFLPTTPLENGPGTDRVVRSPRTASVSLSFLPGMAAGGSAGPSHVADQPLRMHARRVLRDKQAPQARRVRRAPSVEQPSHPGGDAAWGQPNGLKPRPSTWTAAGHPGGPRGPRSRSPPRRAAAGPAGRSARRAARPTPTPLRRDTPAQAVTGLGPALPLCTRRAASARQHPPQRAGAAAGHSAGASGLLSTGGGTPRTGRSS